METRMQSLAAAVAAASPPPPVPSALPLWTLPEVEACRTPLSLLRLFLKHELLLPLHRPCPKCSTTLTHHADDRFTDGYRLRCNHCHCDFSPRHGSFFADFRLPLRVLAQLLVYFDTHTLVQFAAQYTGVHRHTVSKLYAAIRVRCRRFLDSHPVRFRDDELVEIDELYLKSLREPESEEEKSSWPPLIGMISRDTKAVALEVAPTKSEADVRRAMEPHLSPATPVLTDGAGCYHHMGYYRDHAVVKKEHGAGGAAWPKPGQRQQLGEREVAVHTNTIEGYWSQFRTWLHASHGWPADYLPLVLAECMFRSLHLPLSVVLRPL